MSEDFRQSFEKVLTDCERLGQRIHKISDSVLAHELRLAEDRVLIQSNSERLDNAIRTMATSEQLRSMELNLGLQLANARTQLEGGLKLLDEKLLNVRGDIEPIRKGINWIVLIVLGAVVMALLALVLKSAK